jgi:hypothetical protein
MQNHFNCKENTPGLVSRGFTWNMNRQDKSHIANGARPLEPGARFPFAVVSTASNDQQSGNQARIGRIGAVRSLKIEEILKCADVTGAS